MGALKLTYNQGGEALEKSSLFVVGGLEVNGVSDKNRVRTYRYGFNGMEKDDAVAGDGNSLDFGARVYNPRLGRWLSIDPLDAKYPYASPYNFALNTPVWAMDPDGRIVTFANKDSEKAFYEVYRLASDEFKTKLDALKASEVEYHVNVKTTTYTSGNADPNLMGEVSYEFHKDGKGSRVMVELSDKLNFKLGALADELTGASQYEEGKMGFILTSENKIAPIGYDMKDEIETKRNSLQVTEAFIMENKSFGLTEDLLSFKKFDEAGTPEKYFSKSKYGSLYKFTNPPNTNSFASKTLGYWSAAYKNFEVNGYTFKANISLTDKDDVGNPAISEGGNNSIEKSDTAL